MLCYAKQEISRTDAKLEANEAELVDARSRQLELEGTISKLQQEASERERVLAEREKRCVALREDNHRLGSSCNLLEFRVKELEAERRPLSHQLEELKQHEAALAESLLEEGEKSSSATAEVRTLQARQAQLLKSIRQAHKRMTDWETFQRVTQHDLYVLLHDPGRSWENLSKYLEGRQAQAGRRNALGQPELSQEALTEPDTRLVRELTRQRDRMQTTVQKLRVELTRGQQKSRAALIASQSEGSNLLVSNRQLRKHNHQLGQQLKHSREQRQVTFRLPRDSEASSVCTPATKGFGASVELQALENQRLRENLLFFTTQHKPATAPGRSRSEPALAPSLTMPLPPV